MKLNNLYLVCFLLILFEIVQCKTEPVLFTEQGDTILIGDIGAVDLKYDFKIFNKGDKVLKINSILTSCGCTTPQVDNLDVVPGKSAIIPLTFDLKRSSGEKDVAIILKSNIDGPDSTKRFLFKINVSRDIVNIPKRLPFRSGVPANQRINYEINIKNTGNKEIQILKPFINKDYYFDSDIDSLMTIKPESELKLKFWIVIPETGSSIVKMTIPTSSTLVPVIDYNIINDVK